MKDMENARIAGFIIAFIVLVVLLLAVIWPFYRPIAASAIFSVLLIPFFRLFKNTFKSRTVSAALCIFVLVFVILIPFSFIASQMFKELNDISAFMRVAVKSGKITGSINAITGNNYIAPFKTFIQQQINILEIDVMENISQLAESSARYIASNSIMMIKNIAWFITEIFIVLISVFFMLRDSDKLVNALKELSPFNQKETSILFQKIKDTVHATVFGGIVVAAVQGSLGGLGFFILGLPSPALWGAVMAFLAMIPFLGAPVIWFPVVVLLLIKGLFLKGIFLLLWGAFVVGLADNILRPLIIGRNTQLHPLLVFFSVFGGLLLMGPIGLFLGPVILSLTLTIIDFVEKRFKA